MDPFSTIGLASNILSFVDFGWRLVTEARGIYQSASGITDSDKTIKTIANDAQRLCASIVARSTAGAGELEEIAQECQDVADELLGIISKSENSDIVTSIKDIEECNERMGIERKARLVEIKAKIIGKLERLQSDTTVRLMADPESLPTEKKDINAPCSQQTSVLMKELSTGMSDLEASGHEASALSLLLQSLHFNVMRSRHDSIGEAHADTFRWMLEPDPENQLRGNKFIDWLRSDRRLFWIRGKPGSGKSTLMKYLAQNPRVTEHLGAWSGDDRLIICRYFFWNSGSPLQNSEEGLLRSLLFDILRTCPELARDIEQTRRRYSTSTYSMGDWSRRDLLRAFEALNHTYIPIKLVLFIDGLDEYKGDVLELLSTIQKLASLRSTKLCVSSRLWIEFADAFGDDENLVIKLEDLTRQDILRYVVDSLESNQRFQALARDRAAYNRLTDKVVSRAQGVFLWVKLVVRSLLQGATYADSLADMHTRLEEFPADLEAYFEAIVADIPPRYRQRTALTIHVILAADHPLPLIMHYFIDELLYDPDFALKTEAKPMLETDFEVIIDQMTARLDGRFKGLLEAGASDHKPFSYYPVNFIHRTVKDFFRNKFRTTDDLLAMFNPYSVLCHAALALLKSSVDIFPGYTMGVFVEYARQIEEENIKSTKLDQAIIQIEEMETKCSKLSNCKYSLFADSLWQGWALYVRQKIAQTSPPEAHELLRKQINMLFSRNAVESGISLWLVKYLSSQDEISDTDWVHELGEAFTAKHMGTAHQSSLLREAHEILCVFLDLGLPLSTTIADGTLRDYIEQEIKPDEPYGPTLLRYLEEPSSNASQTLETVDSNIEQYRG
ncbi:hypothetical protein O1611_g7481 [Lasiodiplodia mahajangana]|uniref:Uncharacterized protein n=1 Tax=Lasiodiplodia mahajangana TaxID=1108764 RepID=A0ACC2JF90_9PEZI|nr:hypothetical protein O1611_g7481 [Lasiodiplodia mahajangana]